MPHNAFRLLLVIIVSAGLLSGQETVYTLKVDVPLVALDVSVRYHDCKGPGGSSGLDGDRLRFFIVQAAHYLRF